jgi:hypothetical protein
MLANLWPEAAHLDECVSTLRFASRVRCLETSAVVNESSDPVLALRKAERQVKELRQELAMRDMLRCAHQRRNAVFCCALVCSLGTAHSCQLAYALLSSMEDGRANDA